MESGKNLTRNKNINNNDLVGKFWKSSDRNTILYDDNENSYY